MDTTIIELGQTLADTLRQEGRSQEADIVIQLIDKVESELPTMLTTGQVAKRIGVSRQTVVNWVDRGWMEGKRVGGRIMIPASVLDGMDELDEILAIVDADRPPFTNDEARDILTEDRKHWTWIGKEN